jgi:hypothetical protein
LKTPASWLTVVAALGCAVWSCGDDESKPGNTSGGSGGQDAGNDAAGASGSGGSAGTGGSTSSSKLDLLLVVDNSRNMGDKQAVFEKSIATLVSRLTNPRCVNSEGAPAATQPAAQDEACPSGSSREMAPVRDMHVGVVSSSLGGYGSDVCAGGPTGAPEEDDRGELITRGEATTHQNRGYLVWDPDQTSSPPGERSAEALATNLSKLVTGAGEIGCGFEAPLEAFYRFLIDPDPPAAVVVENNATVYQGTNEKVLTQRAQFLRPDSAVLIVVLSDENDCSTYDGALAWLVRQGATPEGNPFTLPRATAECAANPNGACCRSCTTVEASPPAGCPALNADPGCQPQFHDSSTDAFNLRCWDQKRRFGFDLLHPIDRYVRGLTAVTVANRAGEMVSNPLFSDLTGSGAAPRDPSMISVAAIVGVPWQDLARDPRDTTELRYMTAAELASNDRWPAIVGDYTAATPPLDPFMRESIDPRSGTNPISGDAIQPPTSATPTASPINGHEFESASRSDLQYACTFALPEPRVCNGTSPTCECNFPSNKPLCQAPDGSYGQTQYSAKAYPGIRHLELLRRLGDQAIPASICSRNISDSAREDYAYNPAVQAIVDRMKNVIE